MADRWYTLRDFFLGMVSSIRVSGLVLAGKCWRESVSGKVLGSLRSHGQGKDMVCAVD